MTDLSHDATDDGFHEIQLSGKQLVFLFMATTVVSVVIFLCGVLVGRGVRSEALNAAAATTPPLSSAGAGVSSPSPAPPAIAEGPAPADKPLSYPERLDGDKTPTETLKRSDSTSPPVAEAPKPASAVSQLAKVDANAPPVPVTPSSSSKPSGQSAQPGVWAVQVVALTDRAAANAVVDRLRAKDYPAFLVTPQSGSPVQNYKVQVGRFEDRSQAEQIAGRLKKEEQFQPWILR